MPLLSPHRLCIAPMMGCTDRHQRMLMRQLTQHALLYTEMVTAQAVIHGDRAQLIGFNPAEQPVALQLGGSDTQQLATAAKIGEAEGYTEINLNIGCPSDRVQSGRFGACLMADPGLVADCVDAMRNAVSVPVTVKCRIGIDDQQPESSLPRFIETVAAAGCDVFIVHARKAILGGLSPKENREVPPLNYPLVHAIKRANPNLTIVINGGISRLEDAREQLSQVDGVMVGRAAYRYPWQMAQIDPFLFDEPARHTDPQQVVESMLDYIESQLRTGTPLLAMARHMLPLFHGLPGARAWRQHISQHAHQHGAGIEIIVRALQKIDSQRAAIAA